MGDFKPGQTVLLNDGRHAIVRFAGTTEFQVGEWIGVELDEKTGKNDGSVLGVRYFDCAMGYGMFVKPMAATIIAEPAPTPTARPASTARRPAGGRPSSFQQHQQRPSSGMDMNMNMNMNTNMNVNLNLNLGRRMSAGTGPSPTPGPRPPSTSRPPSVIRSRSRSPAKQVVGGGGGGGGPPARTTTPSSHARVPSAQSRSRPSISGSRASMGAPPPPATPRARQHSTASATARSTHAPTKSIGARPQMGGGSGGGGGGAGAGAGAAAAAGSRRLLVRQDEGRRRSLSSQGGHDYGSISRDEDSSSPVRSDDEILSPQPTSPQVGRANVLEKLAVASSRGSSVTPPATKSTPPLPSRSFAASAANREIEDLKAKLKVLDRKRAEDRDKLKQLDKIQADRDKFENIIQKLQQKYQPLQQENTDLRKSLKEAESQFESIEALQVDHDAALELATLDREMAEETAEVLKIELEALREKAEELTLEVEVLREENAEYSSGVSPEDRASSSWLQMERANERLREALIRLRDLTQEQESRLREQVAGLEEDVKEFNALKQEHATAKEKLSQSQSVVEDLRQQLDTALGAEEMIEDLTERNMKLSEQVDELKAVVEDLESLKEINDELEINHVQNEKEMQEEIDFKDTVIAEQARRAAQQDVAFGDMEYTLSRFRELVVTLQGDLEDMRASQAVTEGESEKLNDRSRAMMDLNMKLQISASKAQVKAIDLELRRLEAQEAEQHLDIVRLFLPDSYADDQDSVLAFLRFRRLSFKATLLSTFLREKVNNGQASPGHEDDIIYGCDAIDKLVWVSAICDRFVNDIGHCSLPQFSKYQHALLELEPVERALNAWIDGLRRDDLKEQKCADELQRTISLMSHLAEVHISDDMAAYADDMHMRTLLMQTHLESATVAFGVARGLAQRAVAHPEDEDELAQHFAKRLDLAITQTRSTKVIASKAVRNLEDLKTRSLSLGQETKAAFEECQLATRELASLARQIGHGVFKLLNQDEGRTEPFTYAEINDTIRQAVLEATQSSESDLFSEYLARLRTANAHISDLAALTADLEQTHEFEVNAAPWHLRAHELKSLKKVPVDIEEQMRRLKSEHNEARRTIAQRDEHLSTAFLKIETLESRMRDAQANVERIGSLQAELGETSSYVASLREDIEKQDRELKNLESERDKWKKVASDSRAYADGADAADMKAGQERAVATAREMDALKADIEGLQGAVRYLREDNRRARMTEQQDYEWLAEPLVRPATVEETRRKLVVAEGRDVLGEYLKMASSATVFDLGSMPKDRLAWKPARTTPQHHAACQNERLETWKDWQDSVFKKTDILRVQQRTAGIGREKQTSGAGAGAGRRREAAARLKITMHGGMVKAKNEERAYAERSGVQIVGSREWEALQAATRKFAVM